MVVFVRSNISSEFNMTIVIAKVIFTLVAIANSNDSKS